MSLNQTRSGIDARLVFREAMPAGQYGMSLWCGAAHRFLVSDAVAPGQVAMAARHLREEHAALPFDSLEVNVCSIETCSEARRWQAEVAPPPAVAAGS